MDSFILLLVDLADIRRLVIVAMFSDDELFGKLVLKGGNAISLVYRYGTRGSLDVDFSIEGDFDDTDDAARRITRALTDRFDAAGFVVFDCTFGPRPSAPDTDNPKWGGYRIKFKLIERGKHNQLDGNLETIRRNATVIGPSQQRTFTIDISKWEFCGEKTEAHLDEFAIYVYTPQMLAIEKIRAICQQMPEYILRVPKTGRARDFYDIQVIIEESETDLADPKNMELAKHIFAAKDVPLGLMGLIGKYRDFHRQDWPSVEATVGQELKPFDSYFDFVLGIVKRLESLWIK
ncbi:MAG: nucleotidyl transferase AbiEii/AbiGii toxin family protein [Candidatus Sulfotelmatobacter sp.]